MRNILIILGILLLVSVGSATETKIDISQISQTDFPNSTIANNLVNWNSTYNASYDAKEPAIGSSTASKFYGWDKTFKDILISYVVGLQDFYNAFNTTNSTVQNNLVNWNSTYNATYDSKLSTSDLNVKVNKSGDTMTGALGASNESIRKTTRGRLGVQRKVSDKVARTVMTSGSWTSRTSASAQGWRSIAWSPELGLFAAVAADGVVGVQVMTSTNGTTWTSQTSASARSWRSVVWSPELGIFVAVSYDGTVGTQVMTSTNGTTWTSRTSASAQQWQSVTWSPELGLFAAVAQNGVAGVQVMTSPDGITWTSRTAASNRFWNSIVWSPELGLFVAVAIDGTTENQIMTSPDGITWTSQTSASDQFWNAVAWSPELGLFAAVATDGAAGVQVMTSPDGITWTSRTSASAEVWRNVVWSPELGIFVAVSEGAQIMTSTDGITWTSQTAASSLYWHALTWSPELGIFVAAASNGAAGVQVMTSTPAPINTGFVHKIGDNITGDLGITGTVDGADISGNLVNWNATYNTSYSASLNKTFGFRMDNGTNVIRIGNKSILPSDYSGSIIFARVRTLGSGNLSVTFSKATTAQLPNIWTNMCTINMNLSSSNNTGSACQGQTIAVDDNIRLVVNSATVNNATVTLTLRQD